MKTLSLARPLIMVVVGLPGSGKSFFARQFAETFDVACISADRIRYEMTGKPQYTTEENEAVNRLIEYTAGEIAKTGRSFLIDGASNTRASRLQIEKIAKAQDYKTLVIWVQTDTATARLRSLKRNSKKIDDMFSPSLSDTQFQVFSQRLAAPNKEQYVVISGMHAYSTQARTVLKKLAAPHVQAIAKVEDQPDRQVVALERPDPPRPSRPRNVVIR